MAGRITIQTAPVVKAISPVSINASGNLMAGALPPDGAGETAECAGAGLAAVDMGNETSIGLSGALPRKTTGFKLGIKVHGPPIRSRAKHRTRRESGNGFQNCYQGCGGSSPRVSRSTIPPD